MLHEERSAKAPALCAVGCQGFNQLQHGMAFDRFLGRTLFEEGICLDGMVRTRGLHLACLPFCTHKHARRARTASSNTGTVSAGLLKLARSSASYSSHCAAHPRCLHAAHGPRRFMPSCDGTGSMLWKATLSYLWHTRQPSQQLVLPARTHLQSLSILNLDLILNLIS